MGPGGHGLPHEWSVPPHEPAAPVPHKKALEALAVLPVQWIMATRYEAGASGIWEASVKLT